jgi:hypothetical protein
MMKFIVDDGYKDPSDRLQLMLELTSALLAGTEVYKLYDCILSTCADPKRAYLHLSIVAALANPLPLSQISKLLGPGQGWDTETTLVQLRSVMDIPTDTSLPVNIYHSSVRDYVSDPSNCSLLQVREQDILSPHALLADSSLRLMKAIPKSTALLDALTELQKQGKAMQPQHLCWLKDSLAFLVRPPEPLSSVICMLWLRGDRTSDLQFWLGTVDGGAWLQIQEGRKWLQTQEGQEWSQTEGGREWLQTEGGREWLQAEGGREWLQTKRGREWLQTEGGRGWLPTQEGRSWLQTEAGYDWLQTLEAQDWLQTQAGRDWLQTQEERDWLKTREEREWLQTQAGQEWLQTQTGRDWLQMQGGRDWLQMQEGRDWLQTQEGRGWLLTRGGRGWLLTWAGRDWLQTEGGKEWLQTEGGKDWLQRKGQRWLQGLKGRYWLQTRGGQEWLQTQAGRDWLQTQAGRDWLQSQDGGDWLQTQAGGDWLQTQEAGDWLQTRKARGWLQTQAGRGWLQTQAGRDWLQTQAGRDWLQTQAERDWLQTQAGRDWLQTQAGRDWLQTPHGQAWQSTPAASVWVTMDEFLKTSDAINEYIIVSDMQLLPAFQVIQQFKTLPDFLMFPVFLALRHQHDSTSALPESLLLPDMEIIHAMNAFKNFANEALERSRIASDALKYACHNWAVHLSRAPRPWDDMLESTFQAFWNDHIISWLEMEWCLKGLLPCLGILSEGQKLAKVVDFMAPLTTLSPAQFEPVNAQPNSCQPSIPISDKTTRTRRVLAWCLGRR